MSSTGMTGGEATWMTPFFFLDPSSLGTGMTKKGGHLDDGRRSYLDDIVYYYNVCTVLDKKIS
ncbi:hypothetical protein ACJZL1_00805 [Wolbachia endosymbiont of Rhagoletis indifferens]|uniref:hypothetical protein n=1 Tax=Wolbachia endosymbiont of Rhagoletis indifferens TaxID=3383250 RepID=UPI003AF3662A